MLALEHWGLDPKRDNISIRVIGNDAVRAQAITTGTIDATQLSTYSYATALKRQGYRGLGRFAGFGYSVSRHDGLRPAHLVNQYSDVAEKVSTAMVKAIVFIREPAHQAAVMRSLAKGLRLAKPEDTTEGYEVIKTLYEQKIYPSAEGVRNTIRLLGASNEKIRGLRAEDLIDDRTVSQVGAKGSVSTPFEVSLKEHQQTPGVFAPGFALLCDRPSFNDEKDLSPWRPLENPSPVNCKRKRFFPPH